MDYEDYIRDYGSWRNIDALNMGNPEGASSLMDSDEHLPVDFRFENAVNNYLACSRYRSIEYRDARKQQREIVDELKINLVN